MRKDHGAAGIMKSTINRASGTCTDQVGGGCRCHVIRKGVRAFLKSNRGSRGGARGSNIKKRKMRIGNIQCKRGSGVAGKTKFRTSILAKHMTRIMVPHDLGERGNQNRIADRR